jgi:methyltransferase (TIGR00027 family)
MHMQVDAPPYVLDDRVGLELAAPDEGWRARPDMHPEGTKLFRASMLARARFIEDLVAEQADRGVDQYVILGSGLDTFAQRRPEIACRLTVFEIDQPEHQDWKRHRLVELGYGIPDWLRLVPVDFEAGETWRERAAAEGFDSGRPAVVASTGVSMYLSRQANLATLRQVATLGAGTTLATTFLLPIEHTDPLLHEGFRRSIEGARASGTPFISFFTPEQMRELAHEAGFSSAEHISADTLAERYFQNRTDGLRTVAGEELLVATTG